MSNEKMNQIMDEVYENYKTIHKHVIRTEGDRCQLAIESLEKQLIYNKQEFINKCKTDSVFSEKWGLKIEERGLDGDERWELLKNKVGDEIFNCWVNNLIPFGGGLSEELYLYKIPTKVITISYKENKTESYE